MMKPGKNKVFKLAGKIQHYAWGGVNYIPGLLDLPNPAQKPFAEYWIGAHDNASAEVVTETGEKIPLNSYIDAFPVEALGQAVTDRFGRLPYLLKILDVKDMLSIQVHPSKSNAEIEFEKEQQKGIAPDAPHRNYKDDNHKPELLYALGEFWLLHGFKPPETLSAILNDTPELRFLLPVFEKDGYKLLYKTVMEMDQVEVNERLQPLLDRILPAYKNNALRKNQEDFWAARAALTYNQVGKTDRGIFSIYIFNLVHLNAGETLFQDAGLPHAYLEGQNVEIMANSDNVLRGGLTPKHIDVGELLKHIHFGPTIANIIRETPVEKNVGAFQTPAPDFELGKIKLAKDGSVSLLSRSTQLFIVLEGEIEIRENAENTFRRKTGEAWVSFDQANYGIYALNDAVVFRASVPFKA